MKLTKKVLAVFGIATLLATSLIFTSCGDDDDDPEGAISGSGNNYEVNYFNDGGYWGDDDATKAQATTDGFSGVYRAWKKTKLRHLGALMKFEITNQTTSSDDGVMGLVWDLQKKDGSIIDSDDDVENFLILGFRYQSGKLKYYISKYYNVQNKQSYNFGANETVADDAEGLAKTATVEQEIKTFTEVTTQPTLSDGTVTVWADVYPAATNFGVNKVTSSDNADAVKGAYVVDIYVQNDKPTTGSSKSDTIVITTTQTGYTDTVKQAKAAVYANIYKDKTLTGTWSYGETWAEAEIIEDAE